MKTFLRMSLLGSLVTLSVSAVAQDVPYPN